jgi:hypothetical protein
MTASDGVETHTSSFAFIFFCFFDFRLSTFTHRASAGSLSGGISSESETRVEVFSFFEGTDEDEEGRFMVVAFWEMKCSPYQLARAPHPHRYDHGRRTYSLTLGLSRSQLLPWRKVDQEPHQRPYRKLLWWPLCRCQPLICPLHPSIG